MAVFVGLLAARNGPPALASSSRAALAPGGILHPLGSLQSMTASVPDTLDEAPASHSLVSVASSSVAITVVSGGEPTITHSPPPTVAPSGLLATRPGGGFGVDVFSIIPAPRTAKTSTVRISLGLTNLDDEFRGIRGGTLTAYWQGPSGHGRTEVALNSPALFTWSGKSLAPGLSVKAPVIVPVGLGAHVNVVAVNLGAGSSYWKA